MRIALIHHWNAGGDVPDRIWNSLCRLWPDAERFTSDPWSAEGNAGTETIDSATAVQWLRSTPRRARMVGQSHLRRDQVLSRLPKDADSNTALLEGYDLVISTSPAAAQALTVKTDGIHICFLDSETISGSLQEPRESFTTSDAPRTEKFRELAHETWQAAFTPKLWPPQSSGTANSLANGNAGVTHYFTITHTLAAQLHFELSSQPHAVLYPPIDTTFFRPGPDSHENFLLLVCHPGAKVDLDLVIEACATAKRDLVILGGAEFRSEVDPLPPHVRWEHIPEDTELRSYYRRCRGVISASTTGFDPALVEAQACGTPVIAFHHPANEEIVLDAEQAGLGTCLYYHSLTTPSLVSAIAELERRPQNLSAVLSLGQATKFSPAHFEHSLTQQITRWMAERTLLSRKLQTPVFAPQPSDMPLRRRAAA